MFYIYYLNQEYESGKRQILGTYSDRSRSAKPVIPGSTILEIDDEFNSVWADVWVNPSKYYVDNSGKLWEKENWVNPEGA